MTGLGETAWVDRHLGLAWDRVRAVVPNEEWLPLVTEDGKGRAKVSFEEYGCGRYGCVMPTYEPNVVVKLTSDVTEAFFVAAALSMNDPNAWNGMVEYYAIYRIKNAFHRRRPLYVLWREAAVRVGRDSLVHWSSAMQRDDGGYMARSMSALFHNLHEFRQYAEAVRKQLKRSKDPYALVAEAEDKYADWAWKQISHDAGENIDFFQRTRGAQRLAALLRFLAIQAEMMEHTYLSDGLGESLAFFLENGLLLADVHADNIGLVVREDYGERIVITDPGHAVPLIERWDHVEIEEV
ncbi:MAG: hypothetical protein GY769_20070 [bacterium]|nr:hypothetical protein [bacterium]